MFARHTACGLLMSLMSFYMFLLLVINLLEALNVTRSPRGVSKVKGRDPKTPAWRFRSNLPHLKLPQTFLDYLFNTKQGVLGLHLVGRQSRGSEATLISFTSSTFLQNDERPLLELVSNTKADWLQLEFRSADGLRPEVLKVPGGSPFMSGGWVRMALSVEPRQMVLYVDCQDAVVLKLKEGGQILTLDFPHDLQVIFSSTARKKASKFSVSLLIQTNMYLHASVSGHLKICHFFHFFDFQSTDPKVIFSKFIKSVLLKFTRVFRITTDSFSQ